MPSIKIYLTAEDVQALQNNKNIIIRVDHTKEKQSQISYSNKRVKGSFLEYFVKSIATLRSNGQWRTVETYSAALRKLRRFNHGKDLKFSQLNKTTIKKFEEHMQADGLQPNTTSFYMRIVRAVYNRAVDEGLILDDHPFRHVYTGVAKTQKRAIKPSVIKAIKRLELPPGQLAFARDMFLFSFYTRGMAFVDMAFLKKTDIKSGILTYKRRKTGQTLQMRWEPYMQEIVERYGSSQSEFLLPIVKSQGSSARSQYRNMQYVINKDLRTIAHMVGLKDTLTMYVARHSWASIAMKMNIPIEVISRGMGHTSEKTTQIYLKSLDTSALDKANRKIMNALID